MEDIERAEKIIKLMRSALQRTMEASISAEDLAKCGAPCLEQLEKYFKYLINDIDFRMNQMRNRYV